MRSEAMKARRVLLSPGRLRAHFELRSYATGELRNVRNCRRADADERLNPRVCPSGFHGRPGKTSPFQGGWPALRAPGDYGGVAGQMSDYR